MAARSDKVVYFDAADDAPYALTVEAMDIARQGVGSFVTPRPVFLRRLEDHPVQFALEQLRQPGGLRAAVGRYIG